MFNKKERCYLKQRARWYLEYIDWLLLYSWSKSSFDIFYYNQKCNIILGELQIKIVYLWQLNFGENSYTLQAQLIQQKCKLKSMICSFFFGYLKTHLCPLSRVNALPQSNYILFTYLHLFFLYISGFSCLKNSSKIQLDVGRGEYSQSKSHLNTILAIW